MSRPSAISKLICSRIKRIRERKGWAPADVYERAGIPRSSYYCLEAGETSLAVDDLYRIVDALEVDVAEVWPVGHGEGNGSGSPFHSAKVQEFRLAELVELGEAEGGALIGLTRPKAQVILSCRLSEYFVDRLLIYLEDGRLYSPGKWFKGHGRGSEDLLLYLKSANPFSPLVGALARRYLAAWVELFAHHK